METDSEILNLLDRADAGDLEATGELLGRYQDRLVRIIAFRMDRRLRVRMDANDIIQDTFLVAAKRIHAGKRDQRIPVFVWLRLLAIQQLALMHRQHLGVKARAAGRDISIFSGPMPHATSAVIAAQLLGRLTSPSEAAIRIETQMKVEQRLNELDPIDREILVLRHFEKLSNLETARLLDITESAASNRFIRALKKLKAAMQVEEDLS